MTTLSADIESELRQAERARQDGNEGRARVCARRAAGKAAHAYLTRHGVRLRNSSALAALQMLAGYPGLSLELQHAAAHLTLRVAEDFSLPINADLIEDARKIIGGLD